jgi:hypothetical protein
MFSSFNLIITLTSSTVLSKDLYPIYSVVVKYTKLNILLNAFYEINIDDIFINNPYILSFNMFI